MKEFITDELKAELLEGKKFKVYVLKFPNNKVYVGMSSNEEKRWANGFGYRQNKGMFEDIMNYGWNNIEKKILFENLGYDEAKSKEKEMIIKYNSIQKELPLYG